MQGREREKGRPKLPTQLPGNRGRRGRGQKSPICIGERRMNRGRS